MSSASNTIHHPQHSKTGKSISTPPKRLSNIERRTREYLTPNEIDQLISGAKKIGRHNHRDATIILMTYRHGLRAEELVKLRWDQVNLTDGLIHINRIKNGSPSIHPLRGNEIRALRKLQRDYPENAGYLFISERKSTLTTSTIRKMVARAGVEAELPFPIHPHMLRHSTGYYLANSGQDTRAIQSYLGHKNITHTVRYTELSSKRFNNFWQD